MGLPRLVEERVLCRGRRFALGQRVIEYAGVRAVRDVLLHPGAVVVLPLLDGERVVMLRQFRPGPLEWVYELPAGTREPRQETHEEAHRHAAPGQVAAHQAGDEVPSDGQQRT